MRLQWKPLPEARHHPIPVAKWKPGKAVYKYAGHFTPQFYIMQLHRHAWFCLDLLPQLCLDRTAGQLWPMKLARNLQMINAPSRGAFSLLPNRWIGQWTDVFWTFLAFDQVPRFLFSYHPAFGFNTVRLRQVFYFFGSFQHGSLILGWICFGALKRKEMFHYRDGFDIQPAILHI